MNSLKKIGFVALLLIIAIIILSSCGTTSKTKSSYKEKTEISTEEKKGIDTGTVKKTDLQQQSQTETNTGSTEDTETKKEFNVDFGNGTADDFAAIKTDTTVNGIRIKTTGPGTVKLNADGSIEATGNIKNASYKETGKTKKQDSARTKATINTSLQVVEEKKGIDTSAKKATQKTDIAATNRTVVTTGPTLWGKIKIFFLTALVIALLIIGWRLGWWQLLYGFIIRFFVLFKRKRKDKNKKPAT